MQLDRPVQTSEIYKVNKSCKKNKALGPDGLVVVYYKTFADMIVEPLRIALNEILKSGRLLGIWKKQEYLLFLSMATIHFLLNDIDQ